MSEYKEHKAIANYIKLQYPKVIFTSDSSGIRMTIGNAKKMLALKANCKIPDLLIFEPKGIYHGLIIEIKRTGENLYKKNGELYSKEHLIEQNKTLERLKSKGYKAVFGVGFDECVNIIDDYMNL